MRCSDHAEWHGAPGAAPRAGFPAAYSPQIALFDRDCTGKGDAGAGALAGAVCFFIGALLPGRTKEAQR
jgi:hypothetical protein